MKIKLVRDVPTVVSQQGELFVDNVHECWTIENPEKLIPKGIYEIVPCFMDHLQRQLPMLLSVPGRDGIYIHNCNYANQLEGCIGLGQMKTKDMVSNSVAEINVLVPKIFDACTKQKVFIEIL